MFTTIAITVGVIALMILVGCAVSTVHGRQQQKKARALQAEPRNVAVLHAIRSESNSMWKDPDWKISGEATGYPPLARPLPDATMPPIPEGTRRACVEPEIPWPRC